MVFWRAACFLDGMFSGFLVCGFGFQIWIFLVFGLVLSLDSGMLWDSGIADVIVIVFKMRIVGMLEPGGFLDWYFLGFAVKPVASILGICFEFLAMI